MPAALHYFPLSSPFLMLLAALVAAVITHAAAHAALRIRKTRHAAQVFYALLAALLLGSYINIPLLTLSGERVMSGQIVDYFGMQYVITQVVDWPGTVIAINAAAE